MTATFKFIQQVYNGNKELLRKGDLVICPERTTFREPYLLRFSPLFAEESNDIVPMAIDIQVSMFYATTAGGFKCLDPVLLLMNPYITCTLKILDKLPDSLTRKSGGKSRFEVANYVRAQIAKALGFEWTTLTRKDKYTFLAAASLFLCVGRSFEDKIRDCRSLDSLKTSSNAMMKDMQKSYGHGALNMNCIGKVDTVPTSISSANARENGPENNNCLWQRVKGFIYKGDLDSAYAETLCSVDELILIKLLDRTGLVLESLSHKTISDILCILASYFL
ncbi:hypothetical protein GH714_006284 [Hevea brasiliensis]|uniref:TORTIFOLIA1/TORL1-2 C-terminal domain-containing protein n=1 Tax=Hevea brasiliensis TaxID=3981 RepID=A0A6A6NFV7_HEVBR|nr:hypothetical protein GH714_006284 [Hevea brasiliensis]